MLRRQRRATLTRVTATLGVLALFSALFIVVQILFFPAASQHDDVLLEGENQLTYTSDPELDSAQEIRVSGADRCHSKYLHKTVADVLESSESIAGSVDYSLKELATVTGQFRLPNDEGGALEAALRALCTFLNDDFQSTRIDMAIVYLTRGDPNPARSIFTQFIENKDTKSGDASIQVTDSLRHLGTLRLFDDPNSGVTTYREATERDPASALSWARLGVTLHTLGQTEAAQAAYQQVVDLGNDNGLVQLQAAGYGNLGWISKTLGELDTAEHNYHKALDIYLPMSDAASLAKIYRNLAWIHKERSEWSMAQDYHRKSILEYKKTGKIEGVANAHRALGWIEKNQKNFKQSESHYLQSLAAYEQLSDDEGIANTSRNLGWIYKTRGDLDLAQKSFERALRIYEDLQHHEGISSTSRNLEWVMNKAGNIKKGN